MTAASLNSEPLSCPSRLVQSSPCPVRTTHVPTPDQNKSVVVLFSGREKRARASVESSIKRTFETGEATRSNHMKGGTTFLLNCFEFASPHFLITGFAPPSRGPSERTPSFPAFQEFVPVTVDMRVCIVSAPLLGCISLLFLTVRSLSWPTVVIQKAFEKL